MAHEFVRSGLGKKEDEHGCDCGTPMNKADHLFHQFMRAWFAEHPGFGNVGTYTYNFKHWA